VEEEGAVGGTEETEKGKFGGEISDSPEGLRKALDQTPRQRSKSRIAWIRKLEEQ